MLDDAAWSEEPLKLGQWISYNPVRGDTAPERTDVRVGYDDRFIYVAFHCFSDDAETIRTTISRRDNAFIDDWPAVGQYGKLPDREPRIILQSVAALRRLTRRVTAEDPHVRARRATR